MRARTIASLFALAGCVAVFGVGSAKAGSPLSDTLLDNVTAGAGTGVLALATANASSGLNFPTTLAVTNTNTNATGLPGVQFATGTAGALAVGQQTAAYANVLPSGQVTVATGPITVNVPYISASIASGAAASTR